ncbi:MAG: cytochrome c biogenesis protein ResB [Lentimicrobiaceae bacterium]|nr:cytochrome c biogenesis protein ResB [Lentimicrobiaceae bacterium]
MKVIIKYLPLISSHLGIALIVLAMILGYFHNWRGKAVLLPTDKTNVFITKDNELKIVPFALTLINFRVDFYDSGEPKNFEAIINVEENSDTEAISLRMNHPCKMGFGQDLYLLSYDRQHSENPEFCVVELVYDPFQGLFLAGIILVILGLILNCFHFFRLVEFGGYKKEEEKEKFTLHCRYIS